MASLSKFRNSDEPSQVTNTREFIDYLESHLSWFKQSPSVTTLDVNPQLAYKHEGDFYGFLQDMNVPRHLWWLIMRLNNFTTPLDFTEFTKRILVLEAEQYERLLTKYNSVRKRV